MERPHVGVRRPRRSSSGHAGEEAYKVEQLVYDGRADIADGLAATFDRYSTEEFDLCPAGVAEPVRGVAGDFNVAREGPSSAGERNDEHRCRVKSKEGIGGGDDLRCELGVSVRG